MTEVDYGGGGHRTRLREINNQLVCPRVPPAPVYKGARGRPADLVARQGEGGVLLVGVGLPFPSPTRKEEGGRKERERGRKEGAFPPSLSNLDSQGGARPAPHGLPLFPLRPIEAH